MQQGNEDMAPLPGTPPAPATAPDDRDDFDELFGDADIHFVPSPFPGDKLHSIPEGDQGTVTWMASLSSMKTMQT